MKQPKKQTTKPKGYSVLLRPSVVKEFQRMSEKTGIPLVRLVNKCLDEYGPNLDVRLKSGGGW